MDSVLQTETSLYSEEDGGFSTLSDMNMSTTNAAEILDNTTTVADDDFWEYYLGKNMVTVGALFVIILGTFGNILVFATLVLKKPLTSTTMYMMNLAFADFMVTVLGPVMRSMSRGMSKYDVLPQSIYICKNWWFLHSTAVLLSGWTLMAITIERVFVVYRPLRAKEMCTVKMGRRVLLAIYLFCSLISIHAYWTYGTTEEVQGNKTVTISSCAVRKDSYAVQFFNEKIKSWQIFITQFAVPFVTLLTCNLLIIKKLVEARRMRNELYEIAKKDDDFRSLAAMLLLVSFTHMFCMSPMQILYFVDKTGPFLKPVSSHAQSVAAIRWSFAINLLLLNHGVNFILYSLSGKQFRQDFRKNVFEKIWCCQKKRSSLNNDDRQKKCNSNSIASVGSTSNMSVDTKMSSTQEINYA